MHIFFKDTFEIEKYMGKIFEKIDYVPPSVESLLIYTPLSLLAGMSGEADFYGDYSDEGELMDATYYDDLYHTNN